MSSTAGTSESRVGVYNCVFDQPFTNITTIILPESGDIIPRLPTLTTSVGENVTLAVTYSVSSDDLRWKHDGADITEWNGQSSVSLYDVAITDAGIYECYQDGQWADQKHALMKLIVRACPANKWGLSCEGDCPVCHNGGVCDESTGRCLCAPGFTGDFCEILFGKNTFGQDCGIVCAGSNIDGCQGKLMCLQDPFGCTCAAGFTGFDCQAHCPDGYFGAGCKFNCHCDNDAVCDKGKGTCPSNVPCADGYRGENCQNSCPLGQIGVDACVTCPVPVTVKDLIISVSSNTRLLTWDVTSNMCPVSSYTVQNQLVYRDQCQPVSETFIHVETIDAQTFSYAWEEPGDDPRYLPYSTYKIRVRAWNEAGPGEFENVTSDEFTTDEARPSAPPDNVTSFNVSDNSVSFRWGEVPCGSRGGVVTQYRYQLSSTNNTGGAESASSNEMFVRIDDDVLPCTNYSFQVAAVTMLGPGPYSNLTSVTTSTRAHGPVENLSTGADLELQPDKLQITWAAPDTSKNPCTLEFAVEYELITRDQCESLSLPQRVRYGLGGNEGVIIGGLEAYSTYKVYVRTSNEAGDSEEKSVESITPPAEPTEVPEGFTSSNVTKYSIQLSWDEIPCGDRNAEIVGYLLGYRALEKPYDKMFQPSAAFLPVNNSESGRQRNMTGLEPSTEYEFRVAGIARLDTDIPGPYATIRTFTAAETNIEPPLEPSVDSSLTTSSTVTIKLTPPSASTYITDFQIGVHLLGPISTASSARAPSRHYRLRRAVSPVYVTAEFSKDDLPSQFTVGDNGTYGGYRNLPLEAGAEYEIYFGSVSRTPDSETVVFGDEPLRVKVNGRDSKDSSGQQGVLVAAVLVPSILIVVVATAGVMRRRTRKSTRNTDDFHLDSGNSNDPKEIQKGTYIAAEESRDLGLSNEAASVSSLPSQSPVVPPKPKPAERKRPVQHQPVLLADFEDYVGKKKALVDGNDNGFLKDYKTLPDEILHLCSVARHEKNREKNRYANIIPYDDSRVVLEKLPDEPYSDYVNASYIDGFSEPKKYIASQGPNKVSVNDMWRMVWQENTAKIVMLTNLQEGVKSKCAQYWPDDTATYGQMTIRLKAEETHVDYTIRDFTLQTEDQSARNVRQYHFTSWPDMGVPHDPSKVVSFVKMVKAYNPKDAGHMIVHCSAGVGRTGAFIVLDSMLDQAETEGRVDVWNFVRGMRHKRMKMIQTAAQYEFIFDALLEDFKFGGTAIDEDAFRIELAALKKVKKTSRMTGLQEQFEKLTRDVTNVSSDQCQGGRDPENLDKNRFPDKIPVDRFRPRLMTEGAEGSTDYINACFLNSYSAKSAYIATQMPLSRTIGDLWRMVYDYDCTCIVMLNCMDDRDSSFGQYLPTKGSVDYPPLAVSLESADKLTNNITLRYLRLTNAKTRVSRVVCHLQLSGWPNGRVPASPAPVLKLAEAAREWQHAHEAERVAIHCVDGEGASGTFCALLNILEKLDDTNVVDVCHAVRKLREVRPGIVHSLDEYTFLYQAVQAYLDKDIVYENVQLEGSTNVRLISQV
ncbi:receptor-type tyrosine-protein phosphatase T-like [Acanthaster planci]|uniref:protein-tyrosine-phosphatase n=1 Tax=Acanthaster planci TaxID=133434 RepID=A0A8B7YIQ7_ACAPL|nr:receptor-type tyrosine-protein phosphatase T-like [Acanthaster planci]